MSDPTGPAAVKPRCFVYLRRSQDREDRQQLSIEKQDRRVKEVVKENGLIPIYLLPEEMSARKLGRPVFEDMITRIKAHEARYISVWHLSRLSRNPVDGGMIVHLLDTGDLLGIYTPSRTYRNTPDDKAFLAIELAFAKKNNDDLSEQVKDSFVDKRAHGQYPGPAPIGYINAIIRPGERNIVPDPEKASKVIDCFNFASTGVHTLHDVWVRAWDIGLRSRTGRRLGKQTVAEMLQRRVYAGVFKYGGPEWHKGSYEPLITMELFNKVQVAMGWAKQSKSDKPSTTAGRYYPYKGLLLCQTCKFNVTAYTRPKKLAKGGSTEYTYYTCTKKNRKIVCKEPQIASPRLEKQIKLKASEFEITENDAAECKHWVQELYDSHVAKKNQYIPVWLSDQKAAQQALDTLDEKLEARVISDDRYKARAAQHQTTLARTKELLASSNDDAKRWLELSNETFSGVVNIGEVFEMANDDERRRLMMFLGSNWYLGNKKVALTPRKPLDLLHVSTRNPDWRARPDSNRRSPP